jgi:multiple sugar transport system permease protein
MASERSSPCRPAERMRAVSRSGRDLSDTQFALAVGVPVVVFLVLVVIYPLGYAVWMSFHRIVLFGGYHSVFVGLKNFSDALHDGDFWLSAWVTIRFTVETVVLTMLLGLGLALMLNRPIWGGGLVRTLVFLPWCLSAFAAGLMFAYMARGQTGLGTSIAYALGIPRSVDFMTSALVIEVLALGAAWTMAPLVAFFLLANLETIPKSLYDLAALDQLSRLETFRFVTLPPLRYTLFVFTSIITVLTMKLFDFIFVMTGGGPGRASETLTYLVYKVSFRDLDLGYGAAISLYLLFLIIGATLLLYVAWGRRASRW